MKVSFDNEGRKHWWGRSVERTLVTVFDYGDDFYCWDTGIIWGIKDLATGWEMLYHTIPLPVKINPDTMEPAV